MKLRFVNFPRDSHQVRWQQTTQNRRLLNLKPLAGLVAALFACVVLCTAKSFTQVPAQAAALKVNDVAWMAGNWIGTVAGARAERVCAVPVGGSMMCTLRIIQQQQVVWMEFAVMRDTPKGVVLDTHFFDGNGTPSGPVSNELKLTSATADKATFDNPGGTQPKSEYVLRTGPDSMTSHADLIDEKGNASAIDVTWTRAR
jgi:hypothetical protein